MRRLTLDEFIGKAEEAHDNKYIYSKAQYINMHEKTCIICPIHGEFWQSPNRHLQGQGCPKCANEKRRKSQALSNKEFVEEASRLHNNKYDYKKTEYVNNKTKICVICPIHGEFWQRPNDHLSGKGCPKCANERIKRQKLSSTDDFIKKAEEKHNGKYNYSKTNYKGNRTPVLIICPSHGEFWQKPFNHLLGSGCPKCKASHLENDTAKMLSKYHISFERQKKFKWLISLKKWEMPLDFYLIDYNIAIECQGIQHYHPKGIYTQEIVKDIQQRDILKKQLCEKHGIQIIYINYNDNIEEKIKKIMAYKK